MNTRYYTFPKYVFPDHISLYQFVSKQFLWFIAWPYARYLLVGTQGINWQSHYLECWDIHGTTHCHIWNWIPLHIRLASWLQNKWTKWKWIQKLYLASLGVKHTIQAHALAEPRCHGWPTLIKLFFTWLMKVYVIDKSSDSLTADLRSPEIILRIQSFNSIWYIYKPWIISRIKFYLSSLTD